MVIDHVPLNNITIPLRYSPPILDEMADRIAQHGWFSKLDLKDAFYTIGIHPDDMHLTAFHTPFGDFEFTRLPMGWCNSPAFLQKILSYILGPLLHTCCFVFMDDVIVFSHSRQEHHVHLRQVESAITRTGFILHPTKSIRFRRSISYLNLTFAEGLISPTKPEAVIGSWPVPRTKTQLQAFLGTANYFRGFIPGFASLSEPLNASTGNWAWSHNHTQAFYRLRTATAQAVQRSPHRQGVDQCIICDASLRGIGAILVEEKRPVRIVSRRLTPAERNYDTTERELLGAVWATEKLYLLLDRSRTLTIKTDHGNLLRHIKPSESNRRRNRWIEALARFSIQWEFIPGRGNPADGPSRLNY